MLKASAIAGFCPPRRDSFGRDAGTMPVLGFLFAAAQQALKAPRRSELKVTGDAAACDRVLDLFDAA
jgi:hypothetical protein